MSSVTLNLFERRFPDLVRIGRARLPSLSPEWTDHNAHDPGITLMELLAWVAEAQLYSLSRLRRDEREAYAALFGIVPSGRRAATGLVWPDRRDPESPAAVHSRCAVIEAGRVIETLGGGGPLFRPARTQLWAACALRSVSTRHAGGGVSDHTPTNERGTIAFLPFGETAGPGDVLVLSFTCRDAAGLLGAGLNLREAAWPIGVMAAPPSVGGTESANLPARPSPLVATLVTPETRVRLPIASDQTRGLLATGVIQLDVSGLAVSPTEFSIELSAPRGLARPPRVLRIEPNVIPVEQIRTVHEFHEAQATPNWTIALEERGLRFDAGRPPVVVEVAEPGGVRTWTPGRLEEQGAEDSAYEFNPRTGEVTFGNGVNGRIPPAGASVIVRYDVSDAEQGNVARNRQWRVTGFQGAFGVNPDPMTGGAEAAGPVDHRRQARQRSRTEHALVSAADIVGAAERLPLLEVARAWVVMPTSRTPRTGVVTLVAMRGRPGGVEPEDAPETTRWIAEIRRALVPRMPLGSRLTVRPPRYVRFAIRATVDVRSGREPSTVEAAIDGVLQRRLALVGRPGVAPRQSGVPVTARDIAAWIMTADGVGRVRELRLVDSDGRAIDEVTVPRSGLPKWSRARSDIKVVRAGDGGTP